MLQILSSTQFQGLWQEFWDTNFIKGSTINYISPPLSNPITFTLLIFIAGALFFIAAIFLKRQFSKQAFVKCAIVSFMFAGVLFGLRMDLNWLTVFKKDIKMFSGKDIDERIAASSGFDLKYFMDFVRKTVPEGEQVREIKIDPWDLSHTLTKLGNYYLLPAKISNKGRYVWIYDFSVASYDAETNILTVNDSVFKARLFATYRSGAYIFQIMDEN